MGTTEGIPRKKGSTGSHRCLSEDHPTLGLEGVGGRDNWEGGRKKGRRMALECGSSLSPPGSGKAGSEAQAVGPGACFSSRVQGRCFLRVPRHFPSLPPASPRRSLPSKNSPPRPFSLSPLALIHMSFLYLFVLLFLFCVLHLPVHSMGALFTVVASASRLAHSRYSING